MLTLPRCLAAALLLLLAVGQADASSWRGDDMVFSEGIARWQVGPIISTFAGPSHENLLVHINNYMQLLSSEPGGFEDFGVSMPAGARAIWHHKPRLFYALTYQYSHYNTEADFVPQSWSSHREVSTGLHELGVTLHYGLNFVRSDRIEPYVGGGIHLFYADSDLSIDLINVNGVTIPPDNTELLPDKHFLINSTDMALGPVGFAGFLLRLSPTLAVQAEMQGVMGQVRQTFDYGGSLQHIIPGSIPPNLADSNDNLEGSYQLNVNGLRLSLALLYGF